ncbi:MAG: hypothetical protein ACI4L9_06370 [Candidatus Coproplasma sp.]
MPKYRNEYGEWVDEPENVDVNEQQRQQKIQQVNQFMNNFALGSESKAMLEYFNATLAEGGVSPMTEDDVFNFVMTCKYEEVVNNIPWKQTYGKVYGEILSQKLADYVNHVNGCAVNGQHIKNDKVNFKSITENFEALVQGVWSKFNSEEDVPVNGGLNADEMFDLQNAQLNKMLSTKSQVAYAQISANGTRTVEETCAAARQAVRDAFLDTNNAPLINPDVVGRPDVEKAVAAIRGLQNVHKNRSWGWMFRHPVNYFREYSAIKDMKKDASRLSGHSVNYIERKVNARENKLSYAEEEAGYLDLRRYNENIAEIEVDKADEIARQRQAIEQRKHQDEIIANRADDEVKEMVQAAKDLGVLDESGNYIEPDQDDISEEAEADNERRPIEVDDAEKEKVEEVSQKVEPVKDNPQPEIVPKK